MNSSGPGTLNILIVDDDAASRELMGVLLSDYGRCSYAANGAEAIEVVAQSLNDKEPFDLICLDIMMPEVDGLEALKAIRQLEQEKCLPAADSAKVLMTTTASQVSKTMQAFHHGCSGYLVKPISKENLAKEISKLPPSRSSNAQWRGR
jgi:two-component system chemotaxis response regulator CheY